jgi:hypothetical protein
VATEELIAMWTKIPLLGATVVLVLLFVRGGCG